MQQVKLWLVSACGLAVFAGTMLVLGMAPSTESAAVAAPPELKSHWRNHDGHWSYWHEGDKRWYYTDGSHWYFRDGDAWKLYRFDKTFGREGFERGEYKYPGEGAKIAVPRHGVFIPGK